MGQERRGRPCWVGGGQKHLQVDDGLGDLEPLVLTCELRALELLLLVEQRVELETQLRLVGRRLAPLLLEPLLLLQRQQQLPLQGALRQPVAPASSASALHASSRRPGRGLPREARARLNGRLRERRQRTTAA